jgi:HlyD family secretion protein/macrolide-specific efflux system membrane fusion protein
MIRNLIILCLLTLAGMLGWLTRAWYREGSGRIPESGQTQTARVLRGRLEQHLKARGIVKPAPNALIRVGVPFPKDTARWIGRLKVSEGDWLPVRAELGELNHDDLDASLEQLEAERRVFECRLAALRELAPVEIGLAEVTLEERKVLCEQTGRNLERLRQLPRGIAASAQDWENATAEHQAARARFMQASAQLEQVRTRFRTDLATLEAQILQSKAAIRTIEVQIGWSKLRCPLAAGFLPRQPADVAAMLSASDLLLASQALRLPFPLLVGDYGGTQTQVQVFAVHQRQGELTSGQPNAPVLTLLDPNRLQVHLYIDETDLGRLKAERSPPVTLRAEAFPDQILKGRIVQVLPQPILQENVVYYVAVVEVAAAQRGLLRMEMTVLGHIEVGVNESTLWLPLSAVRSRPEGWYVLRPGAYGPVETPVRVGWKDQGKVEILTGLAEGDEVLLEP